ncbi:heme/hemin ABC transporter substrate-binding protein [Shewanella algae]|uniref:heme/hemin ABC transporter substrate-binding protein n=1 Tax=Shewanella algae TaxID=38313 RepID=UPI0031F4CAE9
MKNSLIFLCGLLAMPLFAAEEPPKRVISAGAGVTELVLALDAAPQLVAVDASSALPKTLKLPRLGYHRMLSAEGILAQKPDLLIGTSVMGPASSIDLVKQAGVPVITLKAADTAEQLQQNILTLGKALNKEKAATELADTLGGRLQQLAQSAAKFEHPPRVMFILLQSERPARVGGADTAADIIIQLAGATNAADFSGYRSLSQEGILALKPELILLSSASEQPEPQADKLLKSMPLLAHTPAGKAGLIRDLQPQALLGGLGISAIEAAESLNQELLEQ